ncbi:MAG TPA: tRNA (adenosine(37)-N6)-dimethylallyltransferase MiaA [Terriglobales bacterium]|nr:tRNA (adenosine(37)-N6)-dimethylallyltransferase MiaA [Terriglobales bacterium]
MPRPASPADSPLLVIVLGPTGSGKTALSLTLARRFEGEIVNCDSMALYREFDIGTAKPGAQERAAIAHHFFDIADPAQQVTAGEYARQARDVLRQISARHKLPVVVGGTGLYLRALVEGLFPGPQRSEELRRRLRLRAQSKPSGYLHRLLSRVDRQAAERIHPHDTPKLIRAIEVCVAARQPMTDMWREGRDRLQGFRVLRLGLDPERQALYARINQRAQQMFAGGLIEETSRLREKYGDAAWPLRSLGYRQAGEFLRGECSLAQALAEAQQAHRNYAKRQMTWFRREPEVHWLRGFGDEMVVQKRAAALIENHLRTAAPGV